MSELTNKFRTYDYSLYVNVKRHLSVGELPSLDTIKAIKRMAKEHKHMTIQNLADHFITTPEVIQTVLKTDPLLLRVQWMEANSAKAS